MHLTSTFILQDRQEVCKQTFLCEPSFWFAKVLFQFYIYIKSTEVSYYSKTTPSFATHIWNIF